ncbi:MAG: CD225/dispanin family protein [Opitutaceae bacterium]
MNYHIARDGQQIGVFPREDVVSRIKQGSIKPTDLAWTEGMADWKPALEVFAEAFATPSHPEQPVPPASVTPPPMVAGSSAGPVAGAPANVPPKPENYLVWAILSTVLCCLPLGIVSIIFAAQVDSKYQAGDHAGALESSRKAKTFAWWAFGVGLLFIIIWGVVQGLAIASAAAGNF